MLSMFYQQLIPSFGLHAYYNNSHPACIFTLLTNLLFEEEIVTALVCAAIQTFVSVHS